MKCKRHKWNVDPPVLGETFCEECGTLFTGKGRPRKDADKPNVLAEIAAGMVGDVPGVTHETVSTDANPHVDSVPQVVIPTEPPTWCKMAGKRMAQAFVMLVEGGCARFAKRQTASPDDDDVDELGKALGEQMAIWFPDSEMSPLAKVGLAATSVAATMIVGSKPIHPPVRSAGTPKPIDVAAPTGETPTANGHPRPIVAGIQLGEF